LVPKDHLAGTVFVGELGLDGRLRPVLACYRQWRAPRRAGFVRR
jgi:predicted ATP-dependent serine protease